MFLVIIVCQTDTMNKSKKSSKAEIVFHLTKQMSQSYKTNFKLNDQSYKVDKGYIKLFDFLNGKDKLDLLELDGFFEEEKINNSRHCLKYLHEKLTSALLEESRKSLRKKFNTLVFCTSN